MKILAVEQCSFSKGITIQFIYPYLSGGGYPHFNKEMINYSIWWCIMYIFLQTAVTYMQCLNYFCLINKVFFARQPGELVLINPAARRTSLFIRQPDE